MRPPSFHVGRTLQLSALLLCIGNLSAMEIFDVTGLAKARGEHYGDTSTPKATYNFAWKVTATSPSTKSNVVGTKEHGIIMDALHHTMLDYEFRQMWMSLMKHNYTLFLQELKDKGHTVFIKPRHKKKDDTFEGEKGQRRWGFLINYFSNMDFGDFERILTLFDYERNQYERIVLTTYSSPPIPEGYWERTHPTFDWAELDRMSSKLAGADWHQNSSDGFSIDWRQFTVEENATRIDPWKFTLKDYLSVNNFHEINPRLFTTPDK